MANSVDPEQTAPIGAVCSGSTLFAAILNLSVMLGNYLQQTASADDIFRCIHFLGALRIKNIFQKKLQCIKKVGSRSDPKSESILFEILGLILNLIFGHVTMDLLELN